MLTRWSMAPDGVEARLFNVGSKQSRVVLESEFCACVLDPEDSHCGYNSDDREGNDHLRDCDPLLVRCSALAIHVYASTSNTHSGPCLAIAVPSAIGANLAASSQPWQPQVGRGVTFSYRHEKRISYCALYVPLCGEIGLDTHCTKNRSLRQWPISYSSKIKTVSVAYCD